jgi:epoxyqueuosine reductase
VGALQSPIGACQPRLEPIRAEVADANALMTPTPERIRTLAADLGFDLVRFGPAEPGADGQRFAAWLDAGRHGEMAFLARNRRRILDPQQWRAGVRSAVALAVDYGGPAAALPGGGQVARYAAARDYHRHVGAPVLRLRELLEQEGVPFGTMVGGSDAVPVLERALAARAGIGFLAKSAMVIAPGHGPYLHLAELLTPLDLPPDPPATGSCGSCTACLDACPTGAITAPYQVDARRCLSYTTIELRGFAAPDLRARQGDRFFGCDVCLDVCPFTRKSPRLALVGDARPSQLRPHRVVETWTLVDVLAMSAAAYESDWVGTAMRRATRSGLRRNAAVVLGNLGDPAALPALAAAVADPDPVVRGHAAWAIGRIDRRHQALLQARDREDDAAVRQEIERALEQPIR